MNEPSKSLAHHRTQAILLLQDCNPSNSFYRKCGMRHMEAIVVGGLEGWKGTKATKNNDRKSFWTFGIGALFFVYFGSTIACEPVTGIFISVIVRHCYTLVTVRHQQNFATATTGVSFDSHLDFDSVYSWILIILNLSLVNLDKNFQKNGTKKAKKICPCRSDWIMNNDEQGEGEPIIDGW